MKTQSMKILLVLGSLLFLAVFEVRGEEENSPAPIANSGESSGDSSAGDGGNSGEIDVVDANNTSGSSDDDDPCEKLNCLDTEICVTGCEGKGEECVPNPECKSEISAAPLIRICRKKNQRFYLCGSKCEDTCDDPNRSCSGCDWFKCQCKKGYLRDRKWNCIRQKDCPETCKTLKCPSQKKCREPPARCVWKTCSDIKCPRYYKCKYGPPARCVRITCDDIKCRKGYKCNERWPPRCVPEQTCANIRCINGWVCDPGPPPKCVRTCEALTCRRGWFCINGPPAKCIRECPKNEVFRECGTACEPTCQNPNPRICTLQCILNVCQCDTGYVRDPESNKCLLPADCP